MNLQIGQRVNVPGSDAQGLVVYVTSVSELGKPSAHNVTLRYVNEAGDCDDRVFLPEEIDGANPIPMDWEAANKMLAGQVSRQARLLAARDRTIARMKAARKSKSRKR